jgi:hypothetical protein
MKKWAPLQFCLIATVTALVGATIGCGGSKFNDPPGVASTAVANTQNPLVAQVTTTTALGCSGQVAVEFGPDTSYGRITSWYPASAASQSNTILVAGMKASTTYHMRVHGQGLCASGTNDVLGPDFTFTTGALPAIAFPTLAVSRPSPSASFPENPGIELIDVIANGTPALFTDRDANPIWYYDVGAQNWPYTFKVLPNGHVLLNIAYPNFDYKLREIDLAGNTIREMDIADLGPKMQAAGFNFIPASFHHDFLALPNGHVIVLVNFSKDFTDLPGFPGTTSVVGDGLVDLDQNWNPVWAWSGFDYLDVNRHLGYLPDWTHSNALVYSPTDGNLLLSMRHQSWVLKIDYNNGTGPGDIIWKLGYQGDFALTESGVPTSDPSQWFSFQHYPSVISQTGAAGSLVTNVAIWDNGDFRVLDTVGDVCGNGTACYSRATVFQVDEGAKVADMSWDNLPGDFSSWGGSINQLENGNVEYDINAPINTTSFSSEVQEVTQTASPQIVWKMDMPAAGQNAYRAYRVGSLYPGVTWSY